MGQEKKKLTVPQTIHQAIMKVQPHVEEYANALTRLRGIVANATAVETAKQAKHRMQTILGYRKRLLKIGAGLHLMLGELAGVDAVTE